ncbi:MAG: HAD family hydrolase [Eubacteriales bacterium]|nr:HAD family hydrolase [Eubacteriales bacterium]MDD3881675.1 HAD family hydrolase [Eubacteriales bacterium]MDD4512266.1 HAD family hydrolase [Eubacteriales bacterium]
MKIEWLFFDVGSTLVDETDTLMARVGETALQNGAPSCDTILAEMKNAAAENADAYLAVRQKYGLEKAKWRWELDRLCPDAPKAVLGLRERFRLGIIANQPKNCMEKLYRAGLPRVFDVCAISEETGLHKPDERLFRLALDSAGACPENAVMIGDRLDNDIIPAKAVGMKTIWLRRGIYSYANPAALDSPPDATVDSLDEIADALNAIDKN